MKTGHAHPRYYVVAVYPDGRRERVVCGKAKEPTPFTKKIAQDHAVEHYTKYRVSTMLEKEMSPKGTDKGV